MDKSHSLDSEYFKKVYDANEDPWNFETSEYEQEKYASTIEALPEIYYENALEIGCSIGVLTKLLAEKCGHLLATDVSQKALDKAIERCRNKKNITFKKNTFPQELPQDLFNLIVISEVAYYLTAEDWGIAMAKLFKMLPPKANILLCHWLPEVHDYPQTGDQVHQSFEKFMNGKMKNVFCSRAESYRIDVWEKPETE